MGVRSVGMGRPAVGVMPVTAACAMPPPDTLTSDRVRSSPNDDSRTWANFSAWTPDWPDSRVKVLGLSAAAVAGVKTHSYAVVGVAPSSTCDTTAVLTADDSG